MTGMIDVHCHLLPNVDDGCPSLDESLACARQLVQAGYEQCFCTPHIWPNLPDNDVVHIPRYVQRLQRVLDHAKIPLRLHCGGEMNLRADLSTSPKARLVTYALKKKYLLIDFWADRLPDFFWPQMRWLQSLKLTVILAHPERVRAFQLDDSLAELMTQNGILLQGNLQCFSADAAADVRRTARRLVAEDRYFMMGSDLHRLDSLPMRLEGLAWLRRHVEPRRLREWMIEHPAKML